MGGVDPLHAASFQRRDHRLQPFRLRLRQMHAARDSARMKIQLVAAGGDAAAKNKLIAG
jgi:hypothetical protein